MKTLVIIPTHNHGILIKHAIRSVVQQKHSNWELKVIADGANEISVEVAESFALNDPRIEILKREKGARHGEAWRHEAIMDSDCDAVCYLCDDDFWFPDHLATMETLLSSADFAHTRQVNVFVDGGLRGPIGDIANEAIRNEMLERIVNYFSPTVVGHLKSPYLQLNQGWSPAPKDVPTDLYMWRKWFLHSGLKLISSRKITGLHFPSPPRKLRSIAERDLELREWHRRCNSAKFRSMLRRHLAGHSIKLVLDHHHSA